METPAGPWTSVDPNKMNPLTKLMYVRSNPNIAVMLIGESVGVEAKLSQTALVEIVQAQIRSKNPDAVFANERSETCGRLDGTAFEMTNTVRGLFLDHWCVWQNGYEYQVVAFGELGRAAEVRAVAREFRSHMRQIDPQRTAASGG